MEEELIFLAHIARNFFPESAERIQAAILLDFVAM